MLLRPLIYRNYGIRIEESCVHRTAAGARLLVLHGDQFDGRLFRNGSKLADRAWNWLTENGLARPPGRGRRWSLGRAIVREGGSLAERYAEAARKRARRDGFDGIVFGHSHVPMLEDRDGCWLANCGAWTRPLKGCHTAIAETANGTLTLLRWPSSPPPDTAALGAAAEPAPLLQRCDPHTTRLIRHIHALWCPKQPFPFPVRRRPETDTPMPKIPRASPGMMPLS